MLVSDILSRSHLSRSEPEFTEDSLVLHSHFVLLNLLISDLIPTDLLPYYTYRSDIIFCKGILSKYERIIEPLPFEQKWNSLSTKDI